MSLDFDEGENKRMKAMTTREAKARFFSRINIVRKNALLEVNFQNG